MPRKTYDENNGRRRPRQSDGPMLRALADELHHRQQRREERRDEHPQRRPRWSA